ncbi:MAG: ATP-binding protein [Candidatus Micrarchaeia archaeon]
MEKERILEVLNDWNFWSKEQPIGIEREEYLNVLFNILNTTDTILAIVGVRRAGKSFLLRQLAKKLMNKGVGKDSILIVNFEDERFGERNLQLLRDIYETYMEEFKSPKNRFIFLDEIQTVREWEKFARGIHERREAKLIISGSSAKMLSEELATLLTGRSLNFFIYPLDFREFLQFKKIEVKNKLELVEKRFVIKKYMKEYLEFGGFPEVVLSNEKLRILLSYFDTVVLKDVVDRFRIREREKIRVLAKYYLSNVSSPVTFRRISEFLKIPLKTTERFSNYLEIANLIFFIKRFSFSLKEQEKSPRKVYAIDTGLSNAIGFRFSENIGRIIENAVALELRRRQSFIPTLEVYYWKGNGGKEVDFVVKNRGKLQLIQACRSVEKAEVKKREIQALLKASNELKCNNLVVVTEDYEGSERVKKKEVKFIPLWRWLLSE